MKVKLWGKEPDNSQRQTQTLERKVERQRASVEKITDNIYTELERLRKEFDINVPNRPKTQTS